MKPTDQVFPRDDIYPDGSSSGVDRGLTVRDYVAIRAMQGILANPSYNVFLIPKSIIRTSYELSDALIAESNKHEN